MSGFPSPSALARTVFEALSAAFSPDIPLWIRQAWTNPSPPPPAPDQDVLYYHLVPDPAAVIMERERTGSRSVFFRFAPYRLNLVFYGPNAESLSWNVYQLLFLDGWGFPLSILHRGGIYPVPGAPGPSLIREEWEKQHRLRADLTVPLRVAFHESLPAPAEPWIQSVPEIRLET